MKTHYRWAFVPSLNEFFIACVTPDHASVFMSSTAAPYKIDQKVTNAGCYDLITPKGRRLLVHLSEPIATPTQMPDLAVEVTA